MNRRCSEPQIPGSRGRAKRGLRPLDILLWGGFPRDASGQHAEGLRVSSKTGVQANQSRDLRSTRWPSACRKGRLTCKEHDQLVRVLSPAFLHLGVHAGFPRKVNRSFSGHIQIRRNQAKGPFVWGPPGKMAKYPQRGFLLGRTLVRRNVIMTCPCLFDDP